MEKQKDSLFSTCLFLFVLAAKLSEERSAGVHVEQEKQVSSREKGGARQ